MTLQELWELFPIALAPHDGKWKAQYREEYKLQAALADAKSQFVRAVTEEARRAYGDRY